MITTRKAGDTLILSGTLDESVPVSDSAWTDAVARINIVNSRSLAPVVNHAVVPLVVAGGVRSYSYRGVSLPQGDYLYEIEVTFNDGTIWTFPNDDTKMILRVLPQLI